MTEPPLLPVPHFTQPQVDAILTEWGGAHNFITWLNIALRQETIRRWQARTANQHPLAEQPPQETT